MRLTGSLRTVFGTLEKLVLESHHGRACLLDEDHESVATTLRPNLLGESDQTIVGDVLDRAFSNLGTGRQWPKHHVATLNFRSIARVINANAASCEEIDDTFLHDIFWLCLLARLLLLDGWFSVGATIDSRIVGVLLFAVLFIIFSR